MEKGVREAERRIAVVGGDARLDLAGLELTDSDLRTLRPNIGNLTALTDLWLDNNQLTVVPEAIGNLTALTSLDVSDNKLTLVPEAIGKLTDLTELGLSGNPILETAKVLNRAGTDPEDN